MSSNETKLIEIDSLTPSPWRSTYIVKQDLRLLAASLKRYGWLSPIVAYGKEQVKIVDGHERVAISSANRELLVDGIFVPVVLLSNLSDVEAMIMHVTLNRAKGEILNARLSKLIRTIVNSGSYDANSLMQTLGMTSEEFQVLIDGSLMKMRKVSEHTYSRAWVPIEAKQDERPKIERPPNADG